MLTTRQAFRAVFDRIHDFQSTLFRKSVGVAEFLAQRHRVLIARLLLSFLANLVGSYTPRRGVSRQRLEFRINRALARVSSPRVSDPLFFCEVAQDCAEKAADHDHEAGRFAVSVVFEGLKVAGFVTDAAVSEVAVAVDGETIRTSRTKKRADAAEFSFKIRRGTLETFPPNGELTVLCDDRRIVPFRNRTGACITVPHGTGTLEKEIERRGLLDKKGRFRPTPEETADLQNRLFDIYDHFRDLFTRVVGKPLIVTFGTLLGVHRDGALIPGDDDFDVSYVSDRSSAGAVKREAIEITEALVGAGATILLNQRGKPFRLQNADRSVHIDCCPIWWERGRLWAPPYGHLDLDPATLQRVEERSVAAHRVLVPADPEPFLEAYYGPGWRSPDPNYSSSSIKLDEDDKRNLAAINLRPHEAAKLKKRLDGLAGTFQALSIHNLYPLDEYEKHCGW